MSRRPPFDSDASFTAWLGRDAQLRPPEALLEQVLARTRETRRRPGWLILERWLPMETTARFGALPRGALILVILALLLGSFAVIGVGSQPSIVPAEPSPPGPGAFSAAPPMGQGRVEHQATLLSDGRLLVTGGYDASSSAELRDPATGGFEPAGLLTRARHFHTATLLLDGRVLLVGGQDEQSAELWDPERGSFDSLGLLAEYRANHTATLLPDGRVLIVGGYEGPAGAEVYDPATDTFSPAGSLAQQRGHHMAALLPDGRVLIVGGPAEAELWDPATNGFSPAGVLAQARWWGTATPLEDGTVLVIGGGAGTAFGEGDGPTGTAELWDPATLTFTPAGTLGEARLWHTATLLPDGRVLVIGGIAEEGPEAPLRSAELWDPATLSFLPAASMAEARGGHSETLLPDGRVLVAGGNGDGEGSLAATEIWESASG